MELIEAIEDNRSDLVIDLLNSGVDVNFQEGSVGESPLMTASRESNNQMLNILLNEGADVNLLDKEGNNALIYAIPLQYGRYERKHKLIVEKLLEHGINPNIKNNDGKSAYDIAMDFGHHSAAELIKHYMDIYDNISRIQALRRGKLTRRKLRTSMARRSSALSRFGDRHGLGEDVIQMLNSIISRPSHIDMIDEIPYNMRGMRKKSKKRKKPNKSKKPKKPKSKGRKGSKTKRSRK